MTSRRLRFCIPDEEKENLGLLELLAQRSDQRTGKHYDLPISHNAVNASGFQQIKSPEIHKYHADQNKQGVRLFNPDLSNTAVSTSNITYVDGPKGLMQYRGYPIGDNSRQEKICRYGLFAHLGRLANGRPTGFETKLINVSLPDQSVFNVIRSFPPDGSCMGMIIAGISALQSTQMPLIPAHAAKNLYMGNSELIDQEIVKFLGSYVIVVAIVYCHHTGRSFTMPSSDLWYIENFFLMTGHVDSTTTLPNPKYVDNFERL